MKMKCNCVQGPELRQTGKGRPDADLYCPVCPLVWWTYKGGIVKEQPAEWPAEKKNTNESWEVKGGGWWKIV